MPDSKSSTPRWLLTVLAVWALVFVAFVDCAPLGRRDYIEDAKKSKAQLGCKSLANVIDAYISHEANTKHDPPAALRDLVHPPFGGSSFLRDGDKDLLDPWGKPYEMERFRRSDGSDNILVKTTALDSTPITQFGIGPSARPHP